MSITLYNTLSRKLEPFSPLSDTVSLYTCGPTVYDYPHIGNWAANIRWDMLYRTLRANNYNVKWIMNITDVGHLVSDADQGEDKLEKGAKREGKTAWEVASYYTDNFIEGMKDLKISVDRSNLVKATDHIAEQIELAKQLESKGFTYIINDGLYFDTSKLTDYGKLARLDIEGLKAGSRVDIGDKRSPTDFALWKLTPEGTLRDMEWASPWGMGFPGWHLECSAMAMKYLGETLDIHTGGIDHIPVHHTNELAQSEAATGKQFVKYWLHSNFLMVNDQKISKSLGNIITLQDIKDRGFTAQELRVLILQSHYRTQADFTWETLGAARARLKSYSALGDKLWQQSDDGVELPESVTEIITTIQAALSNDLNTPEALSALSQFASLIAGTLLNRKGIEQLRQTLEIIDTLLGLDLADSKNITTEQSELIEERAKARENKDWERSDTLRNMLKQQGIDIKDSSSGQTWNRL